jgi:hypothetical protein
MEDKSRLSDVSPLDRPEDEEVLVGVGGCFWGCFAGCGGSCGFGCGLSVGALTAIVATGGAVIDTGVAYTTGGC